MPNYKNKPDSFLQKNKSICILPWIHTSVKPNSEAKPCCRFQHYLPEHKDIKNINVVDYKTPQDILQSAAYNELREKMLRGEFIPGCSKCYREEDRHGHSMRMGEWSLYDSKKIIENEDIGLRYLEVAFGNYCNLACRTCNSELSTNWYDDDIILSKDKGYIDRKPWKKVTDVEYNWPSNELTELKQIKFTGGEPMLHPNFIKFIDILIQSDLAKNIKLEIFTNCSWVPKQKVLSRLSKFKEIEICMSIDGFGKLNDYLRHKSKWEIVHDSLKTWLDYDKENPRANAVLSPTISVYNIFDIFELMDNYAKYRTERKLKTDRSHLVISTAVYPEYVGFRNIGDKVRAVVHLEKIYNRYTKDLANYDLRFKLITRAFNKIKNEVEKETNGVHPKFLDFIKDLDEIRKQNLKDYIPNLYRYLEDCGWLNYEKR